MAILRRHKVYGMRGDHCPIRETLYCIASGKIGRYISDGEPGESAFDPSVPLPLAAPGLSRPAYGAQPTVGSAPHPA